MLTSEEIAKIKQDCDSWAALSGWGHDEDDMTALLRIKDNALGYVALLLAEVTALKGRREEEMDVTCLVGEDCDIKGFAKGWLNIADLDIDALADNHSETLSGTAARHAYGAKLQTGLARDEDWAYEFRAYSEPGPGRIKCTIFEPVKN